MHSFCLQQTSLKYVNKHRDRKFYRTEYKVEGIKVLRIPSLVQIVNTIKIQVISMLSFNLLLCLKISSETFLAKIKNTKWKHFSDISSWQVAF